MRTTIHLGLAVSVLLAFAGAPLRHEHASGPHEEHIQGIAHAHLDLHDHEAEVEPEDHDSDASMIDWLAGDGTPPAKFAVTLPSSFAAAAVFIRIGRAAEFTPRNHDPPDRAVDRVRGPPSC